MVSAVGVFERESIPLLAKEERRGAPGQDYLCPRSSDSGGFLAPWRR
jgi:hypothetical protein